jgi:hypothetical protein
MKTRIPTLLIIFSLTCFAFLPKTQAVNPAPDGGYPGFTTAEGTNALKDLTTGTANTAVGWFSLTSNTDGSFNTGVGAGTLVLNVGNQSTGDGLYNTAVGAVALFLNTTGHNNTAVGWGALAANTIGDENTAVGFAALANFPVDNANTAVGNLALLNTTGAENTGVGANALMQNNDGINNTAVGVNALLSSTGNGNIALGHTAGGSVTTASNVICIGAIGGDVDNSCFIGQIYSNVQPIVGTDPDSVTISSTGRLGRGNVSSRRYKHDIEAMGKASEGLFALKPVSFRYNKEYDGTQTLAFGLIAEEVAKVYPDLVGRNSSGEPESVRYDQVNAMLLNEFLKEHRKVEEQQKEIDSLKAELKEQRNLVQRVSAKVETMESAGLVTQNP